MLKKHLFFISLFSSQIAFTQNLKLPLNLRAEDAEYTKLMYITNMFYLKGNQVSNPLDVNASLKDDSAKWHDVILPKVKFEYPIGYGYLFNGGKEHSFMGNNILFLSSNPRYSYYPAIIWIDRNRNFNFTDDGAPDTMFPNKSLKIKIDDKPNGYQIELTRIVRNQTTQMLMNINDTRIVQPILCGRSHHGSQSSYFTKRLNILGAQYANGVDSFLIGIKDVNCNGIYGEEDIDELMVGAYDGILNNLHSVKCGKGGKGYLERYNVAYTIKNIDTDGSFIELYRDTAAILKHSLNKGQKIPHFKFCVPTGKKMKRHRIRKYCKSYSYIYVWQALATEYVRDSAEFHALGRNKSKDFKVISLNYGAGGNYVKYYSRLYGTDIVSGFATNHTIEKLKINIVPTGILLDKKQRIIAVGIPPNMVLNTIESYRKKGE